MGTHRAYQRKAAGGHAYRLRRAAAVSGHRDGLLLRSRSNGKRGTRPLAVSRVSDRQKMQRRKRSVRGKSLKKGWRTPFSFKITPRRARRTGPQALFVGSFCAKLKRPLYRGRGRTDETRHSARVSEQPLFPFPARNACGCERGAQPRPVFLCGGCVHAVVVRHHKPGQHVHGRHLCGH